MIMNKLNLFCLLLVVALAGCDTGKDFADYDNKEEVTGFRESHNEKVLGELEGKKAVSYTHLTLPTKRIV